MATYPIEELIVRYEVERLTYEQAIGHCLQHIQMLTNQQAEAAKSRTKLNQQLESQANQIKGLQAEVKQLTQRLN